MDVVALAEVDRHRQRGVRIGGHGPPLRLAHVGPPRLDRRGGNRAEAGQLHDHERQLGSELGAPARHQAGEDRLVARRRVGIGLALVPHGSAHPERAERRDHAVVERGEARHRLPRRARRPPDLERHHLVAPAAAQRHLRAVVEREGELLGGTGHAAGIPGAQHVDDDHVFAGVKHARRERIGAIRAPTEGVADGAAVHPGLVDLVDGAERERGGARRLCGRQRDRASEPHEAVVSGEQRHAPRLPVPHGLGHVRPLARAGGLRLPGLGAGPGVRAPPVLPHLAHALVGCRLVLPVQAQQVEAIGESAGRAQSCFSSPGLGGGAAPRRADQPHRHLHGVLQLARGEVAGRREAADRLRSGEPPGSARRQLRGRRHSIDVGHGEQPKPIVRRPRRDPVAVPRARDGQLHVRLAGAQEHVADEDVGQRLRSARRGARLEREGPAGAHRRQLGGPAARGVRASARLLPVERDAHRLAGGGAAPHGNRAIALQDGVVLEDGGEQRLRRDRLRRAALERRGVLDVARPLVLRVRRVGAQRPAAAGEAAARGPDGLRWDLVLDPVDDGAQHVEGVERRRSAATVAHPRHQEEPAPAADRGRPAVRPGHALVVVDGVEGREPGVADAVVEEELAAAAREGVEVRPARGRRQLHLRLGGRVLGSLVHVHLGRRERRAHGVRAAGEQPRYALAGGDARVEQEARVHLPPLGVLRAGERFRQGLDLRLREAAVRLRPRATQRGGIESAADRVRDHAVAQAVGGVAGGEHAVDDGLPIGVRERATAVRLPRGVERRHAVQHRRDPLVTDAGEARAHRRRADHDPVEVGGIALRHQHALAPAGGAAHEVRVRGGPAVVLREDLLREHGHAPDGLVGEVEARLLLRHEGRVEDLPAVTGVGGDHGEAADERRIPLPRPSERRRDGAVQAAPALEQEAPVPLGRAAPARSRCRSSCRPRRCAGRASRSAGSRRAAVRRAEPPRAAPAAAARPPRTTPPSPPTTRRPAPAVAVARRTRARRP